MLRDRARMMGWMRRVEVLRGMDMMVRMRSAMDSIVDSCWSMIMMVVMMAMMARGFPKMDIFRLWVLGEFDSRLLRWPMGRHYIMVIVIVLVVFIFRSTMVKQSRMGYIASIIMRLRFWAMGHFVQLGVVLIRMWML